MFCCGIDIAKHKHEATVIDETGKALLDSISFSNSKEGCENLRDLFARSSIPKNGLLIVMEPTGHYRLSVQGCLLEQGFEVRSSIPSSLKRSGKCIFGRRRAPGRTASSSPRSCDSGSSPPRIFRKKSSWLCGGERAVSSHLLNYFFTQYNGKYSLNKDLSHMASPVPLQYEWSGNRRAPVHLIDLEDQLPIKIGSCGNSHP